MKQGRSPALWLLAIPAQLVLGGLFSLLGVWIDSRIFSGGGQGHGVPIFSVLFPIIALVVTLLVVVLAIVLMAVGFSRRSKAQREALLAQAAQQSPQYPQQSGAWPTYPPQQGPPQQ